MKVLLDSLEMDRPTTAELRSLGSRLTFYKGMLPEMFREEFKHDLLFHGHTTHGITVERTSLSSGLKAILDGCELAPYVRAIFWLQNLRRTHKEESLSRAVSSVTPKRHSSWFRINKGMLDMSQDVNDHMPPELRPIPFPNMIYVGDGPTDVPCFTVMRRNGGQAIAPHNPEDPSRLSFKNALPALHPRGQGPEHRSSDFRRGSHLRLLIEMVHEIASQMIQRRRNELGSGNGPRAALLGWLDLATIICDRLDFMDVAALGGPFARVVIVPVRLGWR